ncbi:class I SAM-dependent methyltransferase [Faunimonas sp. B44]|uniref:class I SAM-dependent methyltransferase n=1 Tax=Faunimonas sp. B44 TaxID=3461493 RepID=UPI0040449075
MTDPAAFVRDNTELLAPPLVPEIRLHLAHEALRLWEKTEEELGAMGLPPPYWAFAWAGGQALARFLLDRPETVAGATVLDFASGSGLVGIAAARAGAARVLCAEIDDFALAAIALNAAANAVALDLARGDLIGRDEGWDLVLVGDAFYEKPLADRLAPWLDAVAGRGADILVGDPGRSYLPKERLTRLSTHSVPVTRALEDSEIKRTDVLRWTRRAERR